MNHKIIRTIGILGAVLVATAVLTMGISWVRASETPLSTLTTTAQVDSSFTYQGSLDNNGTAVNGNCDFQFSLFDAANGGSQAGITLPKSNVPVSDGLFTVALDFGNQFTGEARYLQIAVSCPAGSGSFTTLNGRVALTATPYALSLMPGASVLGNSSGFTFEAANTASGAGVRGETLNGNGVEGVVDWVNGGTGVGVYGAGGFYGSAGLFENGNANIPTIKIQNFSGSSAPALVVTGTTRLEGDLTWKAATSYLSIPAAALQPNDESLAWDLSNDGTNFFTTNSTYYVAPVFLPHNATVTGISTWWADGAASDATLMLRRVSPGAGAIDMATLSTSGSSGFVSTSNSTTISNPIIDNSQYSYLLYVLLPDTAINYYQTVIEYTTTQPH